MSGFASAYANVGPIGAPEPLPLRRALPLGEPFLLPSLGPVLEAAARAIMDRVQCPDTIAAQLVLAAASLAVQAHADVIIPATGHARFLSLLLVTVATSGVRILRHPARLCRCWTLRKDEQGCWAGVLRDRSGAVEARTERGPLALVHDAIKHSAAHRGVSVSPIEWCKP